MMGVTKTSWQCSQLFSVIASIRVCAVPRPWNGLLSQNLKPQKSILRAFSDLSQNLVPLKVLAMRYVRILRLYGSVLGKRPWALKHNSQFWPTWALTRDQNSIYLNRSCYSGSLKCGTWTLTREWVLARDTTVYEKLDHVPSSCTVLMVHVVKGCQYTH